jgi:PTS system galactitol-specific IIB component
MKGGETLALPRKKRVLIVCGSSIATSTMVAMKVEELLREHKIDADIRRCMTSEAKTAAKDADLIVATSQVDSVAIPVISGIPFITGLGMDKVKQEIVDTLRSK